MRFENVLTPKYCNCLTLSSVRWSVSARALASLSPPVPHSLSYSPSAIRWGKFSPPSATDAVLAAAFGPSELQHRWVQDGGREEDRRGRSSCMGGCSAVLPASASAPRPSSVVEVGVGGTERRWHDDVDRSLSLLFVSSLLIQFRERAATNIGRCCQTRLQITELGSFPSSPPRRLHLFLLRGEQALDTPHFLANFR